MTWPGNSLPAVSERLSKHGSSLIAGGLIVLVANTYSVAIPITSGMALVALGSTLVVASRFRSSPARLALIAAHVFTYSTLYLLLVGAVLHASFVKSSSGLYWLQSLDIAMSMVPMVATIRIAITEIVGGGDAPAR